MNWKFEAIEKLMAYEAKKNSLLSIPEEIARLEEAACGIRAASTDARPVTGGCSTREDMLLSNIVLRQELERQLSDAERWVKIVDGGLAVLSDDDKRVLELMYINSARGNVDRLCEELSIEKSGVYKRRDKALRKLTLALYGITET